MSNPLRVLLLDDRPANAKLMVEELRRAGFDPDLKKVETESDYLAQLNPDLDVILADSLPQLDALQALHLLEKAGLDIPFIIVSGKIGEESVATCMRNGAADYLLKDRMARLGQAVRHALDRKRLREEQGQAEALMRGNLERYELASLGANDGLWDWNLIDNQVYFSARLKSMFGYDEPDVAQSPDGWFNLVHPDDLAQVQSKLATHFGGRPRHFEHECRMQHRDGTYRWMLIRAHSVRDSVGEVKRLAGSFTDITARKEHEEQLLHDAFHDALTGLPNRALLVDRLKQFILHGKRNKAYTFAALFVDLDGFRIVNDGLGHAVGDQMLLEVSKRLLRCVRLEDTVARLGGDEFALLLDDIKDISNASRVANRVQQELEVPCKLDGRDVFTSASIGIAFSTTGYDRYEDVMRDADTAMYRAKGMGKARFVVFDSAMHAQAMARLKLETDLRRAVERQEFRLYYQPIVDFDTGGISGFEALLRWQHPERGLITPMEYLSVAEEIGLLVPVGRWVLHCACRQLREWQLQFPARPPLTISVNLSSKQLLQLDLIKQVDQILAETGLEASSLRLEVTETVLMEDAESATATLFQLRALNVESHMDDFGTGYSSLSYLQRFPIAALKIDQAFISRMGGSAEDLEIVRIIITLAHNLSRKVIAEGVETEEHFSLLKSLKCEYGQGYFFSKPLDHEGAQKLLATGRHW